MAPPDQKIDKLVIATTNRGKLTELNEMLAFYAVSLGDLSDYPNLTEAPEDGATFAENALQKALHYAGLIDCAVMADDSGLEIDALDGAPGVYSGRFAVSTAAERDRANNQKVLELLGKIPPEKRTGRFRCSLCLARGDRVLFETDGYVEGLIIETPRGNNGFGYDPIFFLPQYNRTIAELPAEQKNAISHRGRALQKLMGYLEPFLVKATG